MDLAELSKAIGVDLVKDAEFLEPLEGEYDFKIYTRDHKGRGAPVATFIEKNAETGEDEYFISGIASSTIKDLHGDTMLPSALIDMERSARNNLTIFLNHSYEVPEDVAGSVVAASLQASGEVDGNGQPLYDLSFPKVRINKRNGRAVESWQAMSDGTKLGLSIGARIPEGGAIRNKKTGALLIAHVELLETSIVGIPANPRSWIDSATKSLRAGPRRKESEDMELTTNASITVNTADAIVTTVESTEPDDPETIVADDTVIDAVDPSTNTDATSQDLLASEPENDEAVATPDKVAAAPDVADANLADEVPEDPRGILTEAHNALLDVTEQLIEANAARSAAEQRADRAEAERDQMRRDTENVIIAVADLIDRVGSLPVGQKASFKAIQRDFRSSAEIFDGLGLAPEVVRMLRSPSE